MEKRARVSEPRRVGLSLLGGAFAVVLVTLACQDSTGVQWVDSLSLQPDSLYLLPGEVREFSVVPRDQHDNPLPDRAGRVEWFISNPDIALLETTETGAAVTGVTPGATFVSVELGRGSGAGRVFVEPAELSEIRIEPSPIVVDYRSSRVIVTSVLIDAEGNEVTAEGYRVSWRTSSWRIATLVGRADVVTAVSSSVWGRTRGSATLTLVVGERAVSTSVVVR